MRRARPRPGCGSAVPSLLELQRSFGTALVDAGQPERIVPLVRGEPRIAVERLAVYRGNVAGNTARALANAYPIVRKILGEEFFDGLAREYARAHPSTSGDLNDYGSQLAEFVAGFAHTQDLPYLPDVARMEWLAHRAYYAADAAPLDPARLAAVPEADYAKLRPVLAPACGLLASRWPLARIWTVHQGDYAGAFEGDLDSGPDRILVHRPRWRAIVEPIRPGEYRFLGCALGGDSLGHALAAALAEDPEFDLPAALARWVAAGVIVDLSGRDFMG